MKTNNKKKVTLLTLCLLSVLTYMLGSCSGDNDLTGSSDLSINMQIPTTRSADPETPIDINPNNIRTIPIREDECGLYALTGLMGDRYGFNINHTANDFYEQLNTCARDSCGYKGGEMKASTMLTVGQRYGLLTGMEMFDDNTRPEDYFNNEENAGNARIACFQKDGRGHYAKITEVNKEKGYVRYSDSDTKRGTIDIDKLDGIMFYEKAK